MSLLTKIIRGKKAESKYFDQREVEGGSNGLPGYLTQSSRKINKDLYVDLLRLMKSHDVKGTIAILANTTDNQTKGTGMMINKGVLSKKIVAYLHEMKLNQIQEAIDFIKTNPPNFEGCYAFDDKTAAKLNLPSSVAVYPVFNRSRPEFAMLLVFKKNVEKKNDLISAIKKAVR